MRKKLFKILGIGMGLCGTGILVWVFFPIIAYQFSAPASMTFLSPIAESEAQTVDNNLDYTKASSFFPTAKLTSSSDTKDPSFYKISIPRLGIKDATVAIGGEDLAESLIQYPGTSLPGRNGNAVIFGHSVLPSFYNPTNYLTIFSTLPTLGRGDTITINFDGITYKYNVEDKYEVDPTDVAVLDQDQSDSFLSLITCVPPGLTTKRLVVKARIVPVKSI